MLDVAVIGAGMAGIAAARALAGHGLSVTVLEARERVGGRLWSLRDFAALPVEAGAEFIHGDGAATWPRVREAGLATRPGPVVRHTWLDLGHGPQWLPRAVLHPGAWAAFPILRRLRRARPPDLSARAFVEAGGYRGRARLLAELALTGHLPGDLDEVGVLGLRADGVLRLESGRNHRVDAGYDALVRRDAEGLELRLGCAVEAVHWSGDGVRLHTAGGGEIAARAAVSTLPVGVLAGGAVRFEPPLPAPRRAALEKLRMGPVLKLLLRFDEPFWPRRAAQIGGGTGPVTVYWPVFHGRDGAPPVLSAYCTGPRAARLGALSEDEATARVLGDLRRLFPKADPAAALRARRRVDWAADPFARGGYTFLRPGGVGARIALRAADTGALFWAGSATEWEPIAATVEAAYTSGLRAAGEAAAHLGHG